MRLKNHGPSAIAALLVVLSAVSVVPVPLRFMTMASDFFRDPLLKKDGLDEKLFQPGLVRDPFPDLAWHSLALLETAGCADYSLSPGIAKDATFEQRITEGSFPRRRKPESKWRLHLPTENPGALCREVGRQPEVVLALCH